MTTTHEVCVRGVIACEESLGRALATISSLCPAEGHLGPFASYERAYLSAGAQRPAGSVAASTRRALADLRLRCDILRRADEGEEAEEADEVAGGYGGGGHDDLGKDAELEYVSQYDRRLAPPVERRTVYRALVSESDAQRFVEHVARASFLFELVRRGWRFRNRAGELYEVFRVERLVAPGVLSRGTRLLGEHGADEAAATGDNMWVVQIRRVLGATEQQHAQQRMNELMKQLGPYVSAVRRTFDPPPASAASASAAGGTVRGS